MVKFTGFSEKVAKCDEFFSSSGVRKCAEMSAGFWNNYMLNCKQKISGQMDYVAFSWRVSKVT
jgi:hypothetical protein